MKEPTPASTTKPPSLYAEPTLLPTPVSPPAPTGRPTIQTPEIVQQICATIRLHGLSDSAAGLLAGISTSTLSRWKHDDENFQVFIGQARAQFDLGLLTDIRQARKRDGTPDWRAQAWLLQKSSPETYGPPSRRKRLPAASPEVPSNAVSPDALAQLQAVRLAARELGDKPQSDHANIPETLESPAAAVEEMGPIFPESPIPQPAPHTAEPINGAQVAEIPKTPEASAAVSSGIAPCQPPSPIPMGAKPKAQCAKIPKTPGKSSLLKSALTKAAAALHPTNATAAAAAAQNRATAQRLAEEAEEFRLIHEAMDREWERQTDQPSEEWMKDVIPGMWAGYY